MVRGAMAEGGGVEYRGHWERNWGVPQPAEYRRHPEEGWVERRCPSSDPRERKRW